MGERGWMAAAGNMRLMEQQRAAATGKDAPLVFPIGTRLTMEAAVQDAMASGEEVWAWRSMDGPRYVAPMLKRYGFRYVFSGTLLLAETATHGRWRKGLNFSHSVSFEPQRHSVHPWFGDLRVKANAAAFAADKYVRGGEYLVWEKGVPIGCFTLNLYRGVAGLYYVAIHPERRGEGLGTEMVAFALHTANRLGCPYATLQCHPALQRFYAKNGFRKVGVVDAWRTVPGQMPTTPAATADTTHEDLLTLLSGGETERVLSLLDRNRTLLHKRFPEMHGATPLHLAAYYGYASLVQRLLARGADVTAKDTQFNSTPEGWAQHAKQEAVIPLFSTG